MTEIRSDRDSAAFPVLPSKLADVYEICSCLKYAKDSAVYRITRKEDGVPYILKITSDPLCASLLANEENILNYLHAFEDSWHSRMFPRAISLVRDEATDTTFYIRTYIEGKTLEDLCETGYQTPGIELRQTLDYLISLTDQLRFLHSMNPPLIHRDIKPQNIVVDQEGSCHFIDLGIARFFQQDQRSDTIVMGTQLTAPPEQFGYQQCDSRSDLYSLGILFFYCLTGEYQVNTSRLDALDPFAAEIIRRATMFDPANRYQNADEMLADLLELRYPMASRFGSSKNAASYRSVPEMQYSDRSAQNSFTGNPAQRDDSRTQPAQVPTPPSKESPLFQSHPRQIRKIVPDLLTIFITVLITLATVFAIHQFRLSDGRQTANSAIGESESSTGDAVKESSAASEESSTISAENSSSSDEYTFVEPLIEEAVREQLNIADGEPITEADLEKVVSLHIIGLQIYSSEDEIYFQGDYPYVYDNEMQESGLYEQTGTISSLEDITHMPNLRSLCLYRQQITDISVLADESLAITELGLGYNPLTDLSPLTGNDTIESLNLVSLSISDDTVTEVISTMSSLQTLNISSTDIRSLEGLENCPIVDLNLFDIDLDNYMELALLEELAYLEIDHLTASVIQALKELPLKTLFIHYLNGYTLDSLSGLTELEYLTVYESNEGIIFSSEADLPSLEMLYIKNAVITDFYGFAGLDSLRTLRIGTCECESYDGLDTLSGLRTIECTEEQANAIRAQYPDADFYYKLI